MAIETIKAALLVEDPSLYPRLQTNSLEIRDLVDALQSGAILPPIVINKKSRVIIDGWKRRRAHMRVFGVECEMQVDVRGYKNKVEELKDAIALNAAHGQKLCRGDIARCICLAEEFGMDKVDLATAVHLTVERLDHFRLTKTAIAPGGELTPIKYTTQPWAGTKLSKRQFAGNIRASGPNARFLVDQVINLLESDLIDKTNELLMEKLARLAELLKPYARRGKKAA